MADRANLVPNNLPNWQKDFFAFGMKLFLDFFVDTGFWDGIMPI
jgi:hypothetical protein